LFLELGLLILVLPLVSFSFVTMDDLALNDVTLILGADNEILQIINFKEKSDRDVYLKFIQNLKIIFLKLETQKLNSNKIKI
jgi:hypothetical protein